MAVFKCKMCGTEIDTEKHGTNNKCEICGAMYAFRPVERRIADWYDEADALRRDCEFDSAETIYRKIITNDETQADAYWGAVLCKYCVGCVNDRYMFSRVSICRGTSADSIKSDEDFKLALKHGDKGQKSVYNSEVEEIIRTQKEIFNTMSAEEPFDVFISYKETNENEERTKDSDIAEAMYNQLEEEFKVFYAPETLNGADKMGREYLMSIFAAVNSAKVMLVVGSKPEYFKAEWVKSEWSRFLELMKIDRSKQLIPCFFDMKAGDLPNGLAQLQAKNISTHANEAKVIKIVKKSLKPAEKSSQYSDNSSIKKLGFINLEYEEWDKAENAFNDALKLNPTDAECYLGMFMIDLKVPKREDLQNCESPFDEENLNYKKARRYDTKIAAELDGYISEINNRTEEEKSGKIYADAAAKLNSAATVEECEAAEKIFASIKPYSDSAAKIEECKEKANEITYTKALNKLNSATTEAECSDAADIFESIVPYRDSVVKIDECKEKGKDLKEKKYSDALLDFESAKTEADYKNVGEQFKTIIEYKDSDLFYKKCINMADYIKTTERKLNETERKFKETEKRVNVTEEKAKRTEENLREKEENLREKEEELKEKQDTIKYLRDKEIPKYVKTWFIILLPISIVASIGLVFSLCILPWDVGQWIVGAVITSLILINSAVFGFKAEFDDEFIILNIILSVLTLVNIALLFIIGYSDLFWAFFVGLAISSIFIMISSFWEIAVAQGIWALVCTVVNVVFIVAVIPFSWNVNQWIIGITVAITIAVFYFFFGVFAIEEDYCFVPDIVLTVLTIINFVFMNIWETGYSNIAFVIAISLGLSSLWIMLLSFSELEYGSGIWALICAAVNVVLIIWGKDIVAIIPI